jgi:hypothetical protein
MKARVILILVAHIYIMCGCSSPATSDVAALVDVTSEHVRVPRLDEIKSRLAISQDRWAGSTFTLEAISDLRYNARHECKIESSSSLLGNLPKRNKEVTQFWNCLESALNQFEDSAGRDHSSIYLPMMRELDRLVHSTAATRILLVYSDLQENTPGVFSVHEKRDFALLKKEPEAILEKLATQARIPDSLSGIEVHFVYQPMNVGDDERFSLMAEMYADALIKRGAKVIIGMSNHLTTNVP